MKTVPQRAQRPRLYFGIAPAETERRCYGRPAPRALRSPGPTLDEAANRAVFACTRTQHLRFIAQARQFAALWSRGTIWK
jgi:hypothetical protein